MHNPVGCGVVRLWLWFSACGRIWVVFRKPLSRVEKPQSCMTTFRFSSEFDEKSRSSSFVTFWTDYLDGRLFWVCGPGLCLRISLFGTCHDPTTLVLCISLEFVGEITIQFIHNEFSICKTYLSDYEVYIQISQWNTAYYNYFWKKTTHHLKFALKYVVRSPSRKWLDLV